MRSCSYGVSDKYFNAFNDKFILEVFQRINRIREFELHVAQAVVDKIVQYPVYLSLGQEAIAASLSMVVPDYMIFAQHRCHGTYLAFGGDPIRLRDELLGLPSGSSFGRAGSNCLQYHDGRVAMFGHHGLVGENVPLAVGASLGSGKPSLVLVGDGAVEEDYVLSSLGFAATNKLPVLFVCEDNNLSILTVVEARRSWRITDVSNGFGILSDEISDDPWTIIGKVTEYANQLPYLINIQTCRANWHVGVGTDGPTEWDRYNIVRDQIIQRGLGKEVIAIEEKNKYKMDILWDKKQLQTLLER